MTPLGLKARLEETLNRTLIMQTLTTLASTETIEELAAYDHTEGVLDLTLSPPAEVYQEEMGETIEAAIADHGDNLLGITWELYKGHLVATAEVI